VADIIDVVKALFSKSQNPESWSDEDVEPIIQAISGVSKINCYNSPYAAEFRAFMTQWYKFLSQRPDIAARMDPWLVMADLAPIGGQPTATLIAAVAAVPTYGGPNQIAPLPAPDYLLPGAVGAPAGNHGFMWTFATQPQAEHFIDCVRAYMNGAGQVVPPFGLVQTNAAFVVVRR